MPTRKKLEMTSHQSLFRRIDRAREESQTAKCWENVHCSAPEMVIAYHNWQKEPAVWQWTNLLSSPHAKKMLSVLPPPFRERRSHCKTCSHCTLENSSSPRRPALPVNPNAGPLNQQRARREPACEMLRVCSLLCSWNGERLPQLTKRAENLTMNTSSVFAFR